MIDAMEGWYVATSEIPRSVLQTDYNKGDIHYKDGGGNGDFTWGDQPSLLKVPHLQI